MAQELLAPVGVTGVANPKFVMTRLSDSAFRTTGGAWEAYNASNIATYGLVGAEIGATGAYKIANPDESTPATWLFIAAAGSSLAVTDVRNNALYDGVAGPAAAANLASTGLDNISTAAPSGVASNFREMLVQVWRRFFKRTTRSSTQIKTYADNGTSVLTTQAYTSTGSDDDVGAAT